MQRRDFFKTTGLAALAAGLPTCTMSGETNAASGHHPAEIQKPKRLQKGAAVALIAPGSPAPEKKIQQAFDNLTALGFRVKPGKNLRARHGHLAGRDAERLADLHAAFADPETAAVWCMRGGYGCTRLLPYLDYALIQRHPKLLVGYSDITALHLAIHAKTGLVTFHGPVAAADWPENTVQHFRDLAMTGQPRYLIAAPTAAATPPPEPEELPYVITTGQAAGTLTGGNLSLLAAMAGTPYEPSFRGKIVFIEDVEEQPYSVDRMLTQLLQATDLAEAAGIALGVFADCVPKPNTPSLTLRQTLQECLGHLGMPVLYGLPFGHVPHQVTLPYGISAELDTKKQTLTLLEAAVG